MPRERVPTSESLVVLTRDKALAETLKVLGAEHDIVTVDSESALAGELLARPTGVAIIDAAASPQVERLTKRLKSQFPDLVLIVAGRLDDQSTLAAQITGGTVYRFLHKPVSEQRVKLFVDAAWRRHGEELSGVADAMATTGSVSDERAPLSRHMLLIGVVILAALAAAAGWLTMRKPAAAPTPTLYTGEAPPAAARDEQFEILIARADQAFAAGALVAPPAENAADLYKQALLRNGGDPRATAGIERVIDELLSAAETQLAARHFDQAQKLTDRARGIEADHVRVAFLTARIGKERERAVLARVRQAASSGNIEPAIAAIDGQKTAADSGVGHDDIAELTPEAQQARTSVKADAMARLSVLFNQRLAEGQVIDPPSDSAKSYLAQLAQADATHPSTGLARQALVNRALDEARAAVRRQDLVGARRWLLEAHEAGGDDASIATIEQDAATAQENNRRATEIVSAGDIERTRYVPPTYPVTARERGISGWVDVQFVVTSGGQVSDVIITGAEPVGVFEQAAGDAIRKWRYKPVQRDGHAVDQRARLRMKFALDK